METLTIPIHYENEKLIPLKPLPKNKKGEGIVILFDTSNEIKIDNVPDQRELLKIKPLKLGTFNSKLRREDFYE